MSRAPRFVALAKAVIGWACFILVVLLLSAGPSFAGDCPPPPYVPADGDSCTATLESATRDQVERVPVFVVRLRQLEAADLLSWAVPGAVVVVKDGMRKGQTISLPLSLLSGCRA